MRRPKIALKKQCDRCGKQTDTAAGGDDGEYIRHGYRGSGKWGSLSAQDVGDEYGFKMLNKDLCDTCWRLLREDFMNGHAIPVLDRTKL